MEAGKTNGLELVSTSNLLRELQTRFDTLVFFGEQCLGDGQVRCYRLEEGSPFSIAGAALAISQKYQRVASEAMQAVRNYEESSDIENEIVD